MRTIYKYQLSGRILNEVPMPEGAVITKTGMQRDSVCLWALIETNNRVRPRLFKIFPTGAEIPAGVKYVDSIFDGSFVWHLFEII